MTVPRIEPDRVLAVAAYLRERGLENVPLGEIDAAFYFGALRADEIDQLFGIVRSEYSGHGAIVRRLFAEPVDRDGDERIGQALAIILGDLDLQRAEREIPDALDIHLRRAQLTKIAENRELTRLFEEMVFEYEPFIFWFLRYKRPSLGDASFKFLRSEGADTKAAVLIRNGDWTGTDVAVLILDWLTWSDYLWLNHQKSETVSTVSMEARLLGPSDFSWFDSSLPDWLGGRWIHVGHTKVQLVMDFPLPSKELIALFYDSVVKNQRGWDVRLPNRNCRQSGLVACRTWIAGLLSVSGNFTIKEALQEADDLLGTEQTGPQQYSKNRKTLLDRMGIPWVTTLLTPKQPIRRRVSRPRNGPKSDSR